MSTTDFTYRLDTSDAATTPVNTVGGGNLITGGNPTKVSLGGGKNYWRFDGSSLASATAPSKTTTMSSPTGGVTIAFRARIITYPAANAFMFGYCENSGGTAGGPQVRNAAGSSGSGFYYNNSGQLSGTPGTYVYGVGALQTLVMRITPNDPARSSTDYLDIWRETVSRVGTAPDRSNSSGAVASNYTLASLAFNAGMDIYVEQFVIYADQKTDAECALLADDIYSAITVQSVLSGNANLADIIAAGVLAAGGSSEISGNATLADLITSGTLGLAPGVLTSPPFKNWSGSLLPNATIPKVAIVRVSDMAQVLTLTNQTTNGSGILSITNAVLTPGTQYLLITCDANGTAFGCEPVIAA